MKRGPLVFLTSAIALLIIDQMVKFWARESVNWVEGTSILALWPGVFELKLVFNEGVAFGLFQGAGIYLAPIALLITGAAAYYSFRHATEPMIVHLTAALLASGAVGNLIDRIFMGKVTDLFWIRAINFPVFNVADVCITLAGALLLVGGIRETMTKKHADEGATAEASQP
ncbi:MAG: signal peptidase II [Fimbriimonadaceae bacterium]|nr:signal peptidase II [Fimbriimonadaceae bacterium]QYK56711.1 MAG: signal peptidase II [Fimbriimonadaceae bacterium]